MSQKIDVRQVKSPAALSALGNTANSTLDVIFPLINTYFANATAAATASVLMMRDANANVQANNFIEKFSTTVTAAGTTTLTVGSNGLQQFTGITTQNVALPDATTLAVGQSFYLLNRSTGNVTVKMNGGTTLQVMTANSQLVVTVTNIGTSAGVWDVSYAITGPVPFFQSQVTTDSSTTGAAATLQTGDISYGVVRLTNTSLASISGIPAGLAGQQIIVENQTGNSVNVNNNDAGATAANRIFTGTGGAASMAANASFQFVYDVTTARWMLVGGTGSGSGSGGSGKNYLSAVTTSQSSTPNTGNGNFELGSTAGWSRANTALSSILIPTSLATAGSAFSSSSGGTAASANLILSAISSGQIAGTSSGQLASSVATTAGDMMISDAFNIDKADQNAVMSVAFSYNISSGSANVNLSGTSSNTLAPYIYDVTNAQWIQLSGVYNITTGTGTGKFFGQFQPVNSTSTKYQLALVNINASAGAYTIVVDDFSVGPITFPGYGMAGTDWRSDLTFTASSGFGPPSSVITEYKIQGDELFVRGQFTTGGVAASVAYLQIPGVFTIDYSKWPNTVATNACGKAYIPQQMTAPSADGTGEAVLFLDGTTNNQIFFAISGGGNVLTKANVNALVSSSQAVSFSFSIPLLGHSSQSQIISQYDGRLVAASYYASASGTASTTQTVNFDTKVFDTHNAVTASAAGTGSWRFTAPVTGVYDVSGSFIATVQHYWNIYKNGSSFAEIGSSDSSAFRSNSTYKIQLNAGEYFDIRPDTSITFVGGSVTAQNAASKIQVALTSGAQQIMAGHKITAEYYMSANQSVTANVTPFNFDTKIIDTAGAVTTGTGWMFTAPVSGDYLLSVTATSNSGNMSLFLYKNGSSFANCFTTRTNGDAYDHSTVLTLNAGDYIQYICAQSVTINGGGTPYPTYVAIKQI